MRSAGLRRVDAALVLRGIGRVGRALRVRLETAAAVADHDGNPGVDLRHAGAELQKRPHTARDPRRAPRPVSDTRLGVDRQKAVPSVGRRGAERRQAGPRAKGDLFERVVDGQEKARRGPGEPGTDVATDARPAGPPHRLHRSHRSTRSRRLHDWLVSTHRRRRRRRSPVPRRPRPISAPTLRGCIRRRRRRRRADNRDRCGTRRPPDRLRRGRLRRCHSLGRPRRGKGSREDTGRAPRSAPAPDAPGGREARSRCSAPAARRPGYGGFPSGRRLPHRSRATT